MHVLNIHIIKLTYISELKIKFKLKCNVYFYFKNILRHHMYKNE
jgi:hypothetical protein